MNRSKARRLARAAAAAFLGAPLGCAAWRNGSPEEESIPMTAVSATPDAHGGRVRADSRPSAEPETGTPPEAWTPPANLAP